MNILSAIGGVFTALFGGGGGQNLASKVIDKVLPQTQQEREENALAAQDEDIKDVTAARTYNQPDMTMMQYQPGMGLIPFFLMWMLDFVNHVVDAVNHLIRPATFLWLAGGFMGKWKLPDPRVIDPQLWTVFLIVVTFFFGARTLVKDIPAAFAAVAAVVAAAKGK